MELFSTQSALGQKQDRNVFSRAFRINFIKFIEFTNTTFPFIVLAVLKTCVPSCPFEKVAQALISLFQFTHAKENRKLFF